MRETKRGQPLKAGSILAEIETVLAEERALVGFEAASPAGVELQHRKWRLIHKHYHDHPFRVSQALTRTRQWRKVLDHVRAEVPDVELVDWLLQQVQVAENIAAGIRDMRPRKDGPVYDIFMEFVGNKKRKAVAVHHWVNSAKGSGQGAGVRRMGVPDPES
jgi:hypothetical protein